MVLNGWGDMEWHIGASPCACPFNMAIIYYFKHLTTPEHKCYDTRTYVLLCSGYCLYLVSWLLVIYLVLVIWLFIWI